MATTSTTTYTHTCDLCGAERDKAELAHLYGKAGGAMGRIDQGPQADICADCRSRPVGDVLDFLATGAPPVELISARVVPVP
jgi:hypothetical protein